MEPRGPEGTVGEGIGGGRDGDDSSAEGGAVRENPVEGVEVFDLSLGDLFRILCWEKEEMKTLLWKDFPRCSGG